MSFALHLIPLLGFAALMVAAAVEDFRRLVIPNPVVLGLCALWPLHLLAADADLTVGLTAAGCAAAIFFGGAVLFARGVLGGGDVKLFAAATLWVGAAGLPPLLALTGLLGGVMALALLTPLGPAISAWRLSDPDRGGAGVQAAGRVPVPYGIAIAAAALLVTIPPYLG